MPQSQLYGELMVVDEVYRQSPGLSGVSRWQPANGLPLLKKHVGPGSEHRERPPHKLRREQAAGSGCFSHFSPQPAAYSFPHSCFPADTNIAPPVASPPASRRQLVLCGGTLAQRKGFGVGEEGAPV